MKKDQRSLCLFLEAIKKNNHLKKLIGLENLLQKPSDTVKEINFIIKTNEMYGIILAEIQHQFFLIEKTQKFENVCFQFI